MNLDEIDRKIIRSINDDWRKCFTEIGRELGISHTSVSSRLKKLQKKILDVDCTINIEQYGLNLFLIQYCNIKMVILTQYNKFLPGHCNHILRRQFHF